MRLIAFGLLLAAAGLIGAAGLSGRRSPSPNNETEILWDRYGVPHIFARDPDALLYAFGWAQMQAHGDLILRLYGEARGRAAEYWGARALDTDKWVRRMGVPERARIWYDAQSPPARRRLDAFAAGMNAYTRAHVDRIADDVEEVLPVTPVDVIAHGQRVILFEFVTSRQAVDQATKTWSEGGSNAWAVAPSRSASGRGMLVANPHLPWSGFFRWFEAQLVSPEINATGAALVGSPLLGIAFNDHLGWTHTNNTLDGYDLYELTLDDAGYRWNGGARAFDTEIQTIRIKEKNGALRDEPFIIRRSVHGPIVSERPGKAIALRSVGLDEPHIGEQYWDMARAASLDEFERALRRLQNPFYTVMYADRAGHIMHLFGGRTPVRPKGDWRWTGIVPGDSIATLWTATHPYGELPRIVDPPGGWLQNANDPPWTTTFPPAIAADDYPRYMAPRFMSFRAQRSARMLAEDESITFDELVAYKHSTRMELADRVLDDLLPAAREAGGVAANAADVLARWDRTADAASRGGTLFERFWDELTKARPSTGLRADGSWPFAIKWNEKEPRTTPDGFADPKAAMAALERAARSMENDGLAPDVAWGDAHRLRRAGVTHPGNGGPSDLGIFRVVGYRKADDGVVDAVGGDSFMYVAEFSTPVRALTSVAPGNWSQPGSPHNADQLALFAEKRLKPAWRTKREIEANLNRREQVRMGWIGLGRVEP